MKLQFATFQADGWHWNTFSTWHHTAGHPSLQTCLSATCHPRTSAARHTAWGTPPKPVPLQVRQGVKIKGDVATHAMLLACALTSRAHAHITSTILLLNVICVTWHVPMHSSGADDEALWLWFSEPV